MVHGTVNLTKGLLADKNFSNWFCFPLRHRDDLRNCNIFVVVYSCCRNELGTQMINSPILSFALWFPIIGGFIVLLCGFLFEKSRRTLKFVSLSISFVSLILSSIP